MKKRNKGFSLVELIVTIAIMAVLVGILAPTLLRYVEKARVGKDEAAMGEFLNALYLAAADLDAYNDLGNSEITFSCGTGSNTLVILPDSGANSFHRELAGSLGNEIVFSSKIWIEENISVVVDPVWDTINVTMTPHELMTNYHR